jgi:hypothetical protein
MGVCGRLRANVFMLRHGITNYQMCQRQSAESSGAGTKTRKCLCSLSRGDQIAALVAGLSFTCS